MDKKDKSICCLPTATFVSPGRSISVKLTTAKVQEVTTFEWIKINKQIDHNTMLTSTIADRSTYYTTDRNVEWNRTKPQPQKKKRLKFKNAPLGEYILRWIGTLEICLVRPVSLSVSSWISFLTATTQITPPLIPPQTNNHGNKLKTGQQHAFKSYYHSFI